MLSLATLKMDTCIFVNKDFGTEDGNFAELTVALLLYLLD